MQYLDHRKCPTCGRHFYTKTSRMLCLSCSYDPKDEGEADVSTRFLLGGVISCILVFLLLGVLNYV